MGNQLPAPTEGGRASSVQVREAGAGGMLLPQTLTDVITFAKVMAGADIALPKFLRGNEGACLAVAMQAFRWEMDPFAVANKSYYVNDRVAYEAQLIAAVVHTRAPIAKRPSYEYLGEGPTRQCRVTCEMLDGSVKEYLSPQFKDIIVRNSPLWKADVDQQLGYFAIRSWGRRHTPEVLLGVYTPDEVEVMRDVTPRETTGLSEKLQAQAPTGGFRAGVVEDALEAEFEAVETAEASEAAEVADSQPEAADEPAPSQEEAISWPSWVELFRAEIMRLPKTPQHMLEFWTEKFDRIQRLEQEDPMLHKRLHDWFEERLKRLRQTQVKEALDRDGA